MSGTISRAQSEELIVDEAMLDNAFDDDYTPQSEEGKEDDDSLFMPPFRRKRARIAQSPRRSVRDRIRSTILGLAAQEDSSSPLALILRRERGLPIQNDEAIRQPVSPFAQPASRMNAQGLAPDAKPALHSPTQQFQQSPDNQDVHQPPPPTKASTSEKPEHESSDRSKTRSEVRYFSEGQKSSKRYFEELVDDRGKIEKRRVNKDKVPKSFFWLEEWNKLKLKDRRKDYNNVLENFIDSKEAKLKKK